MRVVLEISAINQRRSYNVEIGRRVSQVDPR